MFDVSDVTGAFSTLNLIQLGGVFLTISIGIGIVRLIINQLKGVR